MNSKIKEIYGKDASELFSLFNLTQFHLAFWSTRTLPNVFALVFTNFSIGYWITFVYEDAKFCNNLKNTLKSKEKSNLTSYSKIKKAESIKRHDSKKLNLKFLTLITVCGVIFRSELVLLLGSIFLSEVFYFKSLNAFKTFKILLEAFFNALFVNVLVDSWFWNQKFFWPELKVVIFNVIENKSHLYGTLPFHSYFTNLLMRIAPLTYPISLLSLIAIKETRRFLVPFFCFVFIYSFLPHKEWRFVMYAIPMFNFTAAVFIAKLTTLKGDDEKFIKNLKLTTKFFIRLLSLILLALSISGSFISRLNYPGGNSLDKFNNIIKTDIKNGFQSKVKIHIDSFNAQTGVSLFLEEEKIIQYSKNEKLKFNKNFVENNFTHLLIEKDDKFDTNFKDFKLLEKVYGLESIRKKSIKTYWKDLKSLFIEKDQRMQKLLPFTVEIRAKSYILERRDFRQEE
ncbi:dolichyl-P-Man:Man(7)GlcNAc(2)-PP-dolichol alpha-1,6-mannosyltransferase [Lobulomyces angularis]|nr:dolichyl-P-Man:Man(7)GlcNAc(2)-PP-dolichol alpha-1,6-mannosyltransferase [Lobulomyces angularis]